VLGRYRGRGIERSFRAHAAFAMPEIYELLKAEDLAGPGDLS
jgi:hypothetical protein